MTKAQQKLWSERGVGLAVAIGVMAVLWSFRPGARACAAADVAASPALDVGLTAAGGVLTFLGWIGRQVLAWFQGAKAKRAARRSAASAVGDDQAEAIDGTTAALIEHLRAGRDRAATHAFKSLAALLWPEAKPWPFSGTSEPAKDEAAEAAPATPRKR